MDTDYAAMRRRAREIRDQAIADAHAEYESLLGQIGELERCLTAKREPRLAKLTASVESVIPRNTPFGIADLIRSLEAKDPTRAWNLGSVRRHVTKLRALKIIRCVKRRRSNEPAIYAWGTVEPDARDKTLRQVIQETVKTPMRTAEVVLAILAKGWRTTMIPGHFRTHVIRVLREAGFREVAGKWTAG